MNFKATVNLINIYSVYNKSLSFLGDAYVADFAQFMGEFEDKSVGNYLWDEEIELDEGDTAVVKFIRKVEFHVSMSEYDGIVFQEVGCGVRITEANDARRYNMLRDLLAYDISVTFNI